MINLKAQEILVRILTLGVLGVTLFIEAWKSSEPVNAPKMLILSSCGLAALFVIIASWNRNLWALHKRFLIILLAFLISCILSVILSENNALVGIFGTKGRSTGLVTYLSLAILFFATILLHSKKSYDRIIAYLLLAGFLNIAYNILVMLGFDPIPWTNPYGTILGTFGNPNFISSFLGMIFAVLVVFVLNHETRRASRLLALSLLPLVFYQIIFSRSIQGIFVSAVGTAVVLFFFIRFRLKSKALLGTYLSVILATGFVSILGMLQKGPLASAIYKPSISFRGEYWAAGLNMGISNPLTGVGLDSYGNWYRLYRRPSAMERPGPSVVSDSAHNVLIDFFASGGFPLLLAYIAIQILVIHAIWKIVRKMDSFDATPLALIAAWIGYTSQSIISINQIGLAVWGWVLGGSIIGYSLIGNEVKSGKQANQKTPHSQKPTRSEAATSFAAITGLVVGFLIALPPVRADMAWRSALKSANAGEVEAAMSMWPRNQRTLNSGIVLFANNRLPEKALEWARIDIQENKENFVSWYTLFQLQGISDQEKSEILTKLRQLDPLNQEFQK